MRVKTINWGIKILITPLILGFASCGKVEKIFQRSDSQQSTSAMNLQEVNSHRFIPLTLEEKIDKSNVIVHGYVKSIDSQFKNLAEDRQAIVSKVKIATQEYIKGAGPEYIYLDVLGGTINKGKPNELTMIASHSPQVNTNDEVVLLLERTNGASDQFKLNYGDDSYQKVDKAKRTIHKGMDLTKLKQRAQSAMGVEQ